MDSGRRSRRSSAASQLSAILRPFDYYEPLTLEAREQSWHTAISQQTELPTWTRRPASNRRTHLSAPTHKRTRSSWHAGIGKSQDGLQAGRAFTGPARPKPVLAAHKDEDTASDDMTAEDGASLLQTPTHRSQRRSHRLSHKSQASIKHILSDHHRSQSQNRRSQRRASQKLSALPPMPGNPHHEHAIAAPETDVEKPAPPIPARAPSRVFQTYKPTGNPSGPPEGKDPNLVVWSGPNDPGNPMNWPRSKKWACTIALGLVTFCVTFASSVFSAGTLPAAEYYGTSEEVMILGTALFVLGFSFGPIVWGPFSELFGRKLPLACGFVVFAIFQVPVAVADDLVTLFACRFLAGFFGCAPLTIVGGALADFWNPIDRGIAVSVFSGATFLGPTSGPIVGGYLTQDASLGFRWNSWITLIVSVIFGAFWWFAYPESFGPVLLQRRAKRLRYETRNWAIHAPADEIQINLKAIMSKYLSKPFMMLAMEPILLLITIYISFIYGILYLFFETFPYSYIGQRHWSLGTAGLPFIAVMVGVVIGGVINLAFTKLRFAKIMQRTGRLPPEERLLPMATGAVALPIGLFWFAWTSFRSITPAPQIMSGIPVGVGIVLIFLQGLNYLIDIYLMHSNSAIAGNTFVRSFAGAGFPMFSLYMYRNLGVQWATTVLGFVALALMPVPMMFFIYGARIRKLSKFVPKLPPGMGPGGPPGAGPPLVVVNDRSKESTLGSETTPSTLAVSEKV